MESEDCDVSVDDVIDDDFVEDKGRDLDRVSDQTEQDGADEDQKRIDEAQKSVSSVFSVLIKLLDREVGPSRTLDLSQIELSTSFSFSRSWTRSRNLQDRKGP